MLTSYETIMTPRKILGLLEALCKVTMVVLMHERDKGEAIIIAGEITGAIIDVYLQIKHLLLQLQFSRALLQLSRALGAFYSSLAAVLEHV